mmetsp:Transcript_5365/g.12258  ORF Transcript_5365/g.12258 Transcript_5365/m.12258 type:complete len:208 (-) Transcript_5365:81-704(-)
MKSLCPGVSRMVTRRCSVRSCLSATSMVTPCSRSAVPWSVTHARLKDALPIALLSFSYLCIVRCVTCPHLYSRCPIRVLLPASTCPDTHMVRGAGEAGRESSGTSSSSDRARSFLFNCAQLAVVWDAPTASLGARAAGAGGASAMAGVAGRAFPACVGLVALLVFAASLLLKNATVLSIEYSVESSLRTIWSSVSFTALSCCRTCRT